MIPLYSTVNDSSVKNAVLEVINSRAIATGSYVTELEQRFAKLIGKDNVVSLSDMTSAIFLALHLIGVKQDDEVITTSFACLATNSAIAQRGAIPIWADLKPGSVDVDVDDLRKKITKRTKAVILYHVAGYPGPAREVASICTEHNLALIEDCDNSLLARRNNELVGTYGDFSVYSFYPNRQISAIEGAILVTKYSADAERARKLRRFGVDYNSFRDSYGEINAESDVLEIGWAKSMSNISAAMACAQLSSVNSRVERARKNAINIIDSIKSNKKIKIISSGVDIEPSYWVLLLLASNRDQLLHTLRSKGVYASAIHFRNDRYSGFSRGQNNYELPNTEYLQEHVIGIPCGWWVDEAGLSTISSALLAET